MVKIVIKQGYEYWHPYRNVKIMQIFNTYIGRYYCTINFLLTHNWIAETGLNTKDIPFGSITKKSVNWEQVDIKKKFPVKRVLKYKLTATVKQKWA